MTRPQIVRADTLDLQDHDAPSAKDHTGQPTHGDPLGLGPAAPHQDASLRHIAQERTAEHDYLAEAWGSGRSSHEGSDLLDEDTDFLTDPGPTSIDMRHDDQAAQQNGNSLRSSEDSDVAGDDGDDLEDDMVDKISSSPSIDDEDIDFQFVYALHTFVATVDGQANAAKGDTMVLLDDSNSYWWLVRIVKDHSIGYLPAEHIETPTERLARLNKHRNIDLSATMLSDNNEKPKNPLKTAIRRRRNAKMVSFSTPKYYEASEVDWSDEEEPQNESADADIDNKDERKQEPSDQDESPTKEAVNRTSQDIDPRVDAPPSAENLSNAPPEHSKGMSDIDRPSEESAESSESTLRSTRAGTIRNTDSFFKDDTAEPMKMSLTPNLLRGESSEPGSPLRDKMITPQEFLENNEKPQASPAVEKGKDEKEKKKKEKKQGMLGGLFKRKDKKLKVDEAAGGTVAKHGDELGSPTSISSKESEFNSPRERSPQASRRQPAGGKLTKAPPSSSSLSSSLTSPQVSAPPSGLTSPPSGLSRAPSNSLSSAQPGGLGSTYDKNKTGPDDLKTPTAGPQQLRINTKQNAASQQESKKEGLLSPLTNLMPQNSNDQPKKEKLKRAKHRMELDVDSSPERDAPTPPMNSRDAGRTPPPRNAPPAPGSEESLPDQIASRGLDGMQTQPKQTRFAPKSHPTQFETNTRSPLSQLPQHSQGDSPPSPSTPSESTLQTPETEPKTSTEASSIHTPPTTLASETDSAHNLPNNHQTNGLGAYDNDEDGEWNDEALRNYLDGDAMQDIRDMLIRIYDTSDMQPIGLDHPIIKQYGIDDVQSNMDNIGRRLDGMMIEFWERHDSAALGGTGKFRSVSNGLGIERVPDSASAFTSVNASPSANGADGFVGGTAAGAGSASGKSSPAVKMQKIPGSWR